MTRIPYIIWLEILDLEEGKTRVRIGAYRVERLDNVPLVETQAVDAFEVNVNPLLILLTGK